MPMLPLFDVQYKEGGGGTSHQAALDQPLTQEEANLVIVPRPGPTSEQKSIKVIKGVKCAEL